MCDFRFPSVWEVAQRRLAVKLPKRRYLTTNLHYVTCEESEHLKPCVILEHILCRLERRQVLA